MSFVRKVLNVTATKLNVTATKLNVTATKLNVTATKCISGPDLPGQPHVLLHPDRRFRSNVLSHSDSEY